MGRLLTIDELARETGLEESLLRFYESEHPQELPEKVLRGDLLLFPPQAVPAFLRIHARHTGSRTPPLHRYARVIAVTSGKGGVGKSNLALNLAVEMQRLGRMCLLLDADMGLANIHLLAGVDPGADIREIIAGKRPMAELILEGPEGIGIIPGGGGVLQLADSNRAQRLQIIRALEEVESRADIILVDTAAGMGPGVRDFLLAADEILFVLTPDLTSLADAYGLLKALHQAGPAFPPARPVYSVVNMADTVQQAAGVAVRFSDCAHRFLDREVGNIGYALKDATVGAATMRRTPFTVFRPQARVSRNVHHLAAALLKDERPGPRAGSAFGRYLQMAAAGMR
ncbi:MAG: AAA family ATPase [Desulfobacteraceae bacterium]|nr:AAA family ATPase [Desulfobacteraceae bacterium]